jgi:protein phosphatase 1 regulatory subunit 7
VLDPEFIKANIDQIGKKEARVILREWILGSEDAKKRREALDAYIILDNGKDFGFYEQLFLTDEDVGIQKIAGACLRENYVLDKKLLALLQFVLFEQNEIEPKVFGIDLLHSINTKRARRILRDYLKKLVELVSKDKKEDFSKEVSVIDSLSSSFSAPMSSEVIDIIINLTLAEYYEKICQYNVTLMGGMIVQLRCEGAGLTEISQIKGLDRLQHLVHLNLNRNRIESVVGLDHLKELRSLILSENLIKRLDHYEHLVNLRELNLASNRIEEIIPVSIKNLEKLFLDRNRIVEIKNLDELQELEFLNLSHNHITEINGLNSLINLKSLNLSFNNISSITGLGRLEKLQILHLSNNNIEKIRGLDKLIDLKVLTLSNNKIERIENLDKLVNLKKLEISENRIQRISGLDHQLHLQELFLDRNQVKKIEGVDNLGRLIILFLEKNEIETFKLDDICHLKSLNFIYLNENPLNPESRALYLKKTRFP